MLKHPVTDESFRSPEHTVPDTGEQAAGPSLRLRMDYADSSTAVLHVAGDVDLDTTPRLAELLWSRLRTELSALVIDLGDVGFLGVAGLDLLATAHPYAADRGITLCLVSCTRAVDRALAASGLDAVLPCSADLATARRVADEAVVPVAGTPSVLPL